ncbi:ciliary microtubule inner protein 2B-like [Styela clava]
MPAAATNSWPFWGIEHRRNFSNLREGIHLPGYTGYLPQYKYKLGDTYAKSCEELSKTQIVRKPLPPIPPKSKPGLSEKREDNGLNKYIDNMVPGYTGYVPHRRYNYGENYNDDVTRCIGTFLEEKHEVDRRMNRLQSQVKQSKKLTPIASADDVLEKIKAYNTMSMPNVLPDTKRNNFAEPPKVGWTGYVPRVNVTDIALGKRKAEANQKGMMAFQKDQENREKIIAQPVNPNFEPDEVPPWVKNKVSPYHPEGLTPRYTGYVPHRRFVFGQTYGEMTRQATVCARQRKRNE